MGDLGHGVFGFFLSVEVCPLHQDKIRDLWEQRFSYWKLRDSGNVTKQIHSKRIIHNVEEITETNIFYCRRSQHLLHRNRMMQYSQGYEKGDNIGLEGETSKCERRSQKRGRQYEYIFGRRDEL